MRRRGRRTSQSAGAPARFAEDVLMPLEEEAEALGGRLPDGDDRRGQARPRSTAGLNGGMHSTEHGGQGWTRLEWALVEEQYGRTTNAIHWHVPNAYNVWDARLRRADRALPAAGAARRAQGRLRGHRARRRLRSVADRGDRGAHRRRLSDQRREVVRHLRRPRRRLHRDGERDRRRRAAADPVRRRRRARRDRDRRRPRLHPQLSRRPPDDPLHRRRGRRDAT